MHATYLSPFFTADREKLIESFRDFFKDWDNDIVLLGTGLSGTLALGAIAGIYPNIPIGIVRKEGDGSHSSCFIEAPNNYYNKWAFVDDLICSGDTFSKVEQAVKDNSFVFASGAELIMCVFYNGTMGKLGVDSYVTKTENSYELSLYNSL